MLEITIFYGALYTLVIRIIKTADNAVITVLLVAASSP